MRNYRVPKHLLTRCRFGKTFFANRSSYDRRARRENNKMNNTHAELNFYSSSNEKGGRQFQKLQMKNTNWSFNILMIFHEFSLLNFLWSCRHFILFSIFKITHFLKLEIFPDIFENWEFLEKFPRRLGGKNTEKLIVVLMIRWFCQTDNIHLDLRIRLDSVRFRLDPCDSVWDKIHEFFIPSGLCNFQIFFLDYSF